MAVQSGNREFSFNDVEQVILLEALAKLKASTERAINAVKNPQIVACHRQTLAYIAALEARVVK